MVTSSNVLAGQTVSVVYIVHAIATLLSKLASKKQMAALYIKCCYCLSGKPPVLLTMYTKISPLPSDPILDTIPGNSLQIWLAKEY